MTQPQLRTYRGAAAIITGAASGIGRGLAEALARRGAAVILADRQIELAEAAAAGIRAAGGQARAAEVDMADAAAMEALIVSTAERAGRLDYLFNNAGIGVGGPLERHTLADWDRILAVNLRGVIHGVHSAYPLMVRQGFGHIVNTSAAAGLTPMPGVVAYTATKHAVAGLSLALRAEAAGAGVRVSVLCPGLVRTAILVNGGRYGHLYSDLTPEQQLKSVEAIRPITPAQFARQALDAVARNQAIIVIPGWWKLFWWLNGLSPDLSLWLMTRVVGASRSSAAGR